MTKNELYYTLYKAKSGHPAEQGFIESLLESAEAKDYDSLERFIRDKGARFIIWLHFKVNLEGSPYEAACKLADYCGVPRPEKPAEPEKSHPRRQQKASDSSKHKMMAQYKGRDYCNWKALIHDLREDKNCLSVTKFNSYTQENEHFISYFDWFVGWHQVAPSAEGATRQRLLLKCPASVLPFANGYKQC